MNIKRLHNITTLIYSKINDGSCDMSREDCLKVIDELFPSYDPNENNRTLTNDDLDKLGEQLVDITTHADRKKHEEIKQKVHQDLV